MNYTVRKICLADPQEREQLTALLAAEGLRLDVCLDCTYGLFFGDDLAATASAYKNTLRCIAVRKNRQGEGLLSAVMTELIADRNRCGFFNLFIYTKKTAVPLFETMGFYPIASVDSDSSVLVFMENKKNGFKRYCSSLESSPQVKDAAAVVINANPFTQGHYFLVEQAAAACSHLYLFMVSDDSSLIPFSVREKLIRDSTAALQNISYLKTGDYLISSATFPSYFLKDTDDAIRTQAALDAALFIQIAHTLDIRRRFVGSEPFSRVTGIYNNVLETELAKSPVQLHVIERKTAAGIPISASRVRLLLKEENWEQLEPLLTPAGFNFFQSPQGRDIVQKLKQTEHVVHY